MNYPDFEVADFVADDAFVGWVLRPDTDADRFWAHFLVAHPRQRGAVEQARHLVLSLSRAESAPTETDDVILRRMWQHVGQATKELPVRDAPVRRLPVWHSVRWYAAAASVALLLGAFGWLYQRREAQRIAALPAVMRPADAQSAALAFQTIQGPRVVALPDGSRVRLSVSSSLRFPRQFATNQREVYLVGEAFFAVARRPQQPFLVHTDEVIAKVLGTSFRVRAFGGSPDVSVDVRTGKVAVYLRDADAGAGKADQSVTLTPNQRAVYELSDERLSKRIAENPVPLHAAAPLHFDEAPLEAVFAALEERYGIPIDYDREKLSGCTLTTSVGTLPLFGQLKLVCGAINATYEQQEGRVLVRGEGCQ